MSYLFSENIKANTIRELLGELKRLRNEISESHDIKDPGRNEEAGNHELLLLWELEEYCSRLQNVEERLNSSYLSDFNTKIKVLTTFISVVSCVLLLVQAFITVMFFLVTNNEKRETRELRKSITLFKAEISENNYNVNEELTKKQMGFEHRMVDEMMNKYMDVEEKFTGKLDSLDSELREDFFSLEDKLIKRSALDMKKIMEQNNNRKHEIKEYMSFMVMYLSSNLQNISEFDTEEIKQVVDLLFGESDIIGVAILYFKNSGRLLHIPYLKKAMDRMPAWKPFFEQAIAEIEKREGTTQDS